METTEITTLIEKSLKKLSRMKVDEIRANDAQGEGLEYFTNVWGEVRHECDMFEEEQYDWKEEDLLTPSTYKTALKWLKETDDLRDKKRIKVV